MKFRRFPILEVSFLKPFVFKTFRIRINKNFQESTELMSRIILIVGLTLFTFSIVQAQTMPNGIATRQQTIQKGKVLRKTAAVKSAYYVNEGTRVDKTPQHPLTDSASRTQPMVTKPFIPIQP
jgi:hypothetical protein